MQKDLQYFNLCFELGVPPTLLPGIYKSVFSIEEEIELLAQKLTVKNARKILHELTLVSEHRENRFIPSLAKGIEWTDFAFSDKSDILEDLKRRPNFVFCRLLHFLADYYKKSFFQLYGKI
ncbi:hypothetical protein ACU82A_24955 [Bacillus cereus]